MNADTRISVHCYAGDASQVHGLLPLYLSHGCPVTIMSPEDSPVIVDHPGVDCRFAGTREGSTYVDHNSRTVSVGPASIARQREHMAILLTYPERFFFMCDSDSFCLAPQFPDYLFGRNGRNVAWSNLVPDEIPSHVESLSAGFPHLAMQPPVFLSRYVLAAMLAAANRVTVNPVIPFIDHWLLQLVIESGVEFSGFPDGMAADLDRSEVDLEWGEHQVAHGGKIFVHSAKSLRVWKALMNARQRYHNGVLEALTNARHRKGLRA